MRTTTTAQVQPFLGVIEGFYGVPWAWDVRRAYAHFLARYGYSFYIYAPKGDSRLRRDWEAFWPEAELAQLVALAEKCRRAAVRFGIGFTPFAVHQEYGRRKKQALQRKIEHISSAIAPDILCILFDDMRGDTPGLADVQLKIIEDITWVSNAGRHIICPSYYSTDPLLEQLFGPMPEGYLERLGSALDARIDIFWTGPNICSMSYPADHLAWVAECMRRKPFLWDNYPVNDDKQRSSFLLLKAFEDRPALLAQLLSGHAVNPMKQPWLSQIPLATLPASYALAEAYDPGAAFERVVDEICGGELGSSIREDLKLFCESGLDRLSPEQAALLRSRYRQFDANPFAAEILSWLAGDYRFKPAWSHEES